MNKQRKYFLIFVLICVFSLGIGYARVNTVSLNINGNAVVAENGTIAINNVVLLTKTNNVDATTPQFTDTTVSFEVSFTIGQGNTASDEHSATYEVTIYNDSIVPYSFGSSVFNPTLTLTAPQGETLSYSYQPIGINAGDIIPPKTAVSFQVKLTLYPSGGAGNYSGSVDTTVDVEEGEPEGIITAAFKNNDNSGDVTGSTRRDAFTITVMNSYNLTKTFSLAINGNPNFSLVTNNGSALGSFTIPANTESQDYTFYIQRNNGVVFPNSPQRFELSLTTTDNDYVSIGTVSMAVDVDQSINDFDPPVISSLTVTKGSNTKTLAVSWKATDNLGVDHYQLYLYNTSNPNNPTTVPNLTTTSHTFQNLNDGTYYVKLVAYDGKNNSSERSTSPTAYSWTYTVSVGTCRNCTGTPSTQNVTVGNTATITFVGNSGYTDSRPNINQVRMYNSTTGTNSTTNNYTYNTSTGVFSISNITGNVIVNATGVQDGCLAKGTKVLLFNGLEKNIEDIKYDDLLAVWNYDTGSITYEYPLWIEKAFQSTGYYKVTFDDNTEIKFIYDHSIFDVNKMRFISILGEGFHIGDKIAKIDNKGNFKTVTIKDIELIHEFVTYFFVGSTRYYNIIANNILTTDRLTLISNLYPFEGNAKWTTDKEKLLSNPNNLSDYSVFKDSLPYYLYKGFRVSEAAYLHNYFGLDINMFKSYINEYITNPDVVEKIPNKNGTRYWMVTTDNDIITDKNKSKYLKPEGSKFILPSTYGSWYSTSENKYYRPGDVVTIWHGMHFTRSNKIIK